MHSSRVGAVIRPSGLFVLNGLLFWNDQSGRKDESKLLCCLKNNMALQETLGISPNKMCKNVGEQNDDDGFKLYATINKAKVESNNLVLSGKEVTMATWSQSTSSHLSTNTVPVLR